MNKILVIEDDPDVRDVVVDILEAEGFYSLSACNGIAGLDIAREKQPDLIICDVMMPEMDGYAVLANLRQDAALAVVPFIFLTAKSEKQDIRQGMELGADDYLSKPFTREGLLKAISCRLNRQAALEEKSQQKLEDLRASISFALPHGLRVPLQAIITDAKCLMDDYATIQPGELLEVAETIYGASKTLYRMMQNFLFLAELKLLETSPERLQMLQEQHISHSQAVITDSTQNKALEFDRARDLTLQLQELPVQISEPMLKKIVDELVDNAFKFSLPGDPVQVITACQENRFTLSIIDQGRGFLPGQIEDVGAFTQFDQENYDQDGVGLGLTIAKRLVELHDGELHIESIPGRQTTIRVSLPA